jgi:hypothetical protein
MNRRGDRPYALRPPHARYDATTVYYSSMPVRRPLRTRRRDGKAIVHADDRRNEIITLSGGSLGSCVDEERSQLRELM